MSNKLKTQTPIVVSSEVSPKEIADFVLSQLREYEKLGIVKKYDGSAFQREKHDDRIRKIREDKTLTAEQKVALYQEEDHIFGKF